MQGDPRFTVTRTASSPRQPFGVRAPVPVRGPFVVARRPLASVVDEHQADAVLPDDAAELAPVAAPVVDFQEYHAPATVQLTPPVDA